VPIHPDPDLYRVARLADAPISVFAEMSALATRTGAINLGQGFPDTDGPSEVLEAAVTALRGGANQYPPGAGIASLRQAIARHQQRFYGIEVDFETEVLVTAGATEALAATVLALCGPGDEVICFAPWYDAYAALVELAGARMVTVPLEPPAWGFDPDALRAAVSGRTRLVLVNSPHNPTGRVLSRPELDAIAAVCRERNLLAVTDEVYEHLVFDGRHVPLSTLEGMAERTLTISSAGKTFSVTGWKVGWVSGPAPLVTSVRNVKQFLTYVNGAPFQPAVAIGLGLADHVYEGLAADLRVRRDLLCRGLAAAGMDVRLPEATYFATADVAPLGLGDGAQFCWDLPQRCGVVAIPMSAFSDSPAVASLVRFAFCKHPQVLADAVTRLAGLRPGDQPAAHEGRR
jgi:N-succinyldiaminopimelate aminotransferase